MNEKNTREKMWCVIFRKGNAIHPPVYGTKSAYDVMLRYPGAIRRCYSKLREALRAIELGPDYDGELPPPLF